MLKLHGLHCFCALVIAVLLLRGIRAIAVQASALWLLTISVKGPNRKKASVDYFWNASHGQHVKFTSILIKMSFEAFVFYGKLILARSALVMH